MEPGIMYPRIFPYSIHENIDLQALNRILSEENILAAPTCNIIKKERIKYYYLCTRNYRKYN